MSHNPQLSVRTPQATSVNRAIGFNKPKLNQFFRYTSHYLRKISFQPNSSGLWMKLESQISIS